MNRITRNLITWAVTLVGVLMTIVLVSCTDQRTSDSGPAETSPHSDIVWRRDLDAARREAKQTGKPILVEFFAIWCGACKRMDEQTFTDPKVLREMGQWIPVKMDMDQHPDLAASYRINGVPTLVFLDPDGHLITTLVGFAGPDEVLGLMKSGRR